ncbi:MAG: thioredoxin [Anaerovoracaceae bacterium]
MNAITLKALFCISGVAVGGLLLFSSFETKATERWGIGSALVAESVEVALTRVAELGIEKMDLENSGVKILKGNELTTEVPNAERLAGEQNAEMPNAERLAEEQKAELSGAGRPAEEQGVEMTGAVRPDEETAAKEKPTTKVVHITKADFLKKVYDFEKNPDEWRYLGSQPAIVDFYADWCGPCRQLSPVLDELAKEYSGKLTIYKVNVDNERGLATFFGIRSIPTLLFIPMKGKPQRSLGALSKTELKGIIKDVLKVEL